MIGRNLIVSFTLLIFLSGCNKKLMEIEPDNNIRKNAQQIKSGQIFTGSFFSTNGLDTDYIYVMTDKEVMIKGKLSGVKGVDSEILFFKKGEIRSFKTINDSQDSLEEKFGPLLISPPGVVIALKTLQPLNDSSYEKLMYQFVVELLSPPVPVEREPNDTLDNAELMKDNFINGFYNNIYTSYNDTETDYFSYLIQDSQKFRVSAMVTGVQNIDSVLRVFSETGEQIFVLDNGIAGEPEKMSPIGINGPAKIIFSISAKDNGYSEIDYYQLSVNAELYDDKFELEPNDSMINGTQIRVNKVFGDLSSGSDIDYFWIYNDSPEPRLLSAELASNSSADLVFEVFFGKKGVPLLFNDAPDDAVEGFVSRYVKPQETVYFKVSQSDKGNKRPIEYTLNSWFSDYEPNIEKENNDTTESANIISVTEPIKGFISPNKDQDYFKIDLTKPERYKLSIDSIDGCVTSLSVMDKKGIRTDTVSSDHAGSPVSIVSIIEPGGYIVVNCTIQEKTLYKTPYSLSFQKLDPSWESKQ